MLSLDDVAGALPVKRQGSVHVARGPFHQDSGRPNLVLYEDHYHCFVCGAHGGFAKLLKQVGAEIPSQSGAPPRLHVVLAKKPPPEYAAKTREALLQALDLSEEHGEALRKRGFSDQWIEFAGYRTMPKGSRVSLAERVAKESPVAGVAGFYRRSDGAWSLSGPSGIVIPVRGLHREIRGFQVRPDQVTHGAKYLWLSSAGHPEGVAAEARPHVAFPMSGPIDLRQVWVTEGPLKGDYIAFCVGTVCVAVPGVSMWRLAVRDLIHADRLNLAFDEDDAEASRAAVAAAEAGLKLTFGDADVTQMSWRQGKGADDALAMQETLGWERW